MLIRDYHFDTIGSYIPGSVAEVKERLGEAVLCGFADQANDSVGVFRQVIMRMAGCFCDRCSWTATRDDGISSGSKPEVRNPQ